MHRGERARAFDGGRLIERPALVDKAVEDPALLLTGAAKPGLIFHGLRHGHKTWMIADGVPEVIQSRRLGHLLGEKVQEMAPYRLACGDDLDAAVRLYEWNIGG